MESLRQEQQRWAALTAEERAQEDWKAEQEMQAMVRSMADHSDAFLRALLAAQEAAAKEAVKAEQVALIGRVAAALGATVESIKEVGHE